MAERLEAVEPQLSNRVWTIPNVLSMLRLAGVPLFLYWVLVTEQDGRAILLLMAAGASDYFDGMIARRWNSFTRLGQLLDPLADRLYILATLLALVVRDGLPLWWALTLIGRDAGGRSSGCGQTRAMRSSGRASVRYPLPCTTGCSAAWQRT